MKNQRREVFALALGIALLPPLWAVLAPFLGITTGAVALICAGVYVANGNRVKDGVRISVGFLLGDLWAVAVLALTEWLRFNESAELFAVLFVLGAVAVLASSFVPKAVYLPSWLCGWAVGLTVMGAGGFSGMGTLPLQIAVSMLVGVWYVGYGVDLFARCLGGRGKK